MTEPVSPAKPAFNFGRVVQGAFHNLRYNFRTLIPVAIIWFGLWQFLIGLIPDVSFYSDWIVMPLGFVAQGALIYTSIQFFNNEDVVIPEALRVGFKKFWALLFFGIVSSIGISLGFILLIIPGLVVAAMWIVGSAAIVMEDHTIGTAFERSNELTSGYKGWIVLLIILYFIFDAILSACVLYVMPLSSGGFGALGEALTSKNLLYGVIFSALYAAYKTAAIMLAASGIAAIYYELRFIKEGISPQSIADVFD